MESSLICNTPCLQPRLVCLTGPDSLPAASKVVREGIRTNILRKFTFGPRAFFSAALYECAIMGGILSMVRLAMSLTKCAEWTALQAHHEEMNKVHMRELFRKDAERFDKFRLALGLA